MSPETATNPNARKAGWARKRPVVIILAALLLVGGVCTVLAISRSKQTQAAVPIKTASEMYDHCKECFSTSDISIMAAAVADYSPAVQESEKIKKKEVRISLELVKTRDILAELGKLKRAGQVLVGFALETNNEIDNAVAKLHTKNLDLIVLNSLKEPGAGFGLATNKIRIIGKDQKISEFELKSKPEVAADILDYIQKVSV